MRALRLAIVGAGPAGLYTADALRFQDRLDFSVDLFDRLPTPFGLLRYGVAPDHLKMKSLTVTLQKVLDDPRVRFFGNVTCGRDVTIAELRSHYDGVVYAYGAAADRQLEIPGEGLVGSLSATELVAWYSGHPESVEPPCRLDETGAAVIGMGNVAVDVARILTKPLAELRSTDMPQDVLSVLAGSALADVYMLGRRGPIDAKFTYKELRELGELDGVDVIVRKDELTLSASDAVAIANDPSLERRMKLLREWSLRRPTGAPRRLHLRFGVRPVEILGNGRVGGLVVERCLALADMKMGHVGAREELAVGAVFRAVGYRGMSVTGVPFDIGTGTIPTDGSARVLRNGAVSPGEYAAGWIRRGPTGVLGTNRADGQLVADSLLLDAKELLDLRTHSTDVMDLLESREVTIVTCDGWTAVDRAEIELGLEQGRARAKIVEHNKLLAVSRARSMGNAVGP
jgi:ferredoxin--NADP+ reductase